MSPSPHESPQRICASSTLVAVALGSNLGDSASIIRRAFERLSALAASDFRQSSLWRTTPVNCPPGSPDFVNATVVFEPHPDETPLSLLGKLHKLEVAFGRKPKRVANEARPLDLDIIAFGDQCLSTPELVLPHPRAHLRRFVLCPLCEIAPELVLPEQSKTVSDLLTELDSEEVVEKL